MDEGYQNVAKRNRKIQIISRLKSLGAIVVLLVDYMYDLTVCAWQGMKKGLKSQLTFNPFIEPNS
jgi:hypothetical protein